MPEAKELLTKTLDEIGSRAMLVEDGQPEIAVRRVGRLYLVRSGCSRTELCGSGWRWVAAGFVATAKHSRTKAGRGQTPRDRAARTFVIRFGSRANERLYR